MLVITRFRVRDDEAAAFRAELQAARVALAARPGHLAGTIGRSLDDPGLWTLATTWESVGAYRRALSSYEVKLAAVPTLSKAIDEPSAYEVVEPGADLNTTAPRSLG